MSRNHFVPSNHKPTNQKACWIKTILRNNGALLATCKLVFRNQENASSKGPSITTICYIFIQRTLVSLKSRFEEHWKNKVPRITSKSENQKMQFIKRNFKQHRASRKPRKHKPTNQKARWKRTVSRKTATSYITCNSGSEKKELCSLKKNHRLTQNATNVQRNTKFPGINLISENQGNAIHQEKPPSKKWNSKTFFPGTANRRVKKDDE